MGFAYGRDFVQRQFRKCRGAGSGLLRGNSCGTAWDNGQSCLVGYLRRLAPEYLAMEHRAVFCFVRKARSDSGVANPLQSGEEVKINTSRSRAGGHLLNIIHFTRGPSENTIGTYISWGGQKTNKSRSLPVVFQGGPALDTADVPVVLSRCSL